MKKGSTSKPGINSMREMKPIQPKNMTQNTEPAKSRKSPIMGVSNGGKRYSIKSRLKQTNSVASSSHQRRKNQGADRGFTTNVFTH